MLGRAYGDADLAHDVRLACHGLDVHDNDFVIGLVGRELHPLSHLVQAMRKTAQTSQYLQTLGPFFVGHAVWQSPLPRSRRSPWPGAVRSASSPRRSPPSSPGSACAAWPPPAPAACRTSCRSATCSPAASSTSPRATTGGKVKNLRENPRVTLTVDVYSDHWGTLKGVMIQGRATLIERRPALPPRPRRCSTASTRSTRARPRSPVGLGDRSRSRRLACSPGASTRQGRRGRRAVDVRGLAAGVPGRAARGVALVLMVVNHTARWWIDGR